VPPVHPLSRLEQLAREIHGSAGRLPDDERHRAELIRRWAVRLIDIGNELQGPCTVGLGARSERPGGRARSGGALAAAIGVLALAATVSAIRLAFGGPSAIAYLGLALLLAAIALLAAHAIRSGPTVLDDQWLREAQQRLRRREHAQRVVQQNPLLALEAGIGRPDLPGVSHGEVVDMNNATSSALVVLPGIDSELAEHIIAVRSRAGGFSSLADFGMTTDLPGDTVERLRGRVVFLPHQQNDCSERRAGPRPPTVA
jgi:hypothetical protein